MLETAAYHGERRAFASRARPLQAPPCRPRRRPTTPSQAVAKPAPKPKQLYLPGAANTPGTYQLNSEEPDCPVGPCIGQWRIKCSDALQPNATLPEIRKNGFNTSFTVGVNLSADIGIATETNLSCTVELVVFDTWGRPSDIHNPIPKNALPLLMVRGAARGEAACWLLGACFSAAGGPLGRGALPGVLA